jgi:NAD(P)-dependent dehydrogenase (short-subunit alcohol dehydrogenase family)
VSTAAVVTGAARGIGRAIAERLAADGHTMVLVDIAPELAKTVARCEAQGVAAFPVQADLTARAGRDAVGDALGNSGADPAILVNCAGITRDARIINMTDEAFREVLDVNTGAAFELVRLLAPDLCEGSAIVNIASRAYLGNFGQFNYSMSKGALVGLTRALALGLAPRTRVNAIAPGLVGTEMVMTIPEDLRNRMIEAIPLGRMATPPEIAEVVAFLCSARSSYLTGQVIVAGGGRSLSQG